MDEEHPNQHNEYHES